MKLHLTSVFIIIDLVAFVLFGLVALAGVNPQSLSSSDTIQIDLSRFDDSAHHWRDITDEDRVISQSPNQERYSPENVVAIADNILLYQQPNGGWPKNYDMLAVLTNTQKDRLRAAKGTLETTFDNGATHSQVDFLARAYTKTGDSRYKQGALHGIRFIRKAQYKNGGWPQFYPDTSGYRKYITYNDNAMIGIMKVLQDIVQEKPWYTFVGNSLREEVRNSFQKGIECILATQIRENGKLTIWCQQHDNADFRPRTARAYELPSKASRESADIVLFLMSLNRPGESVIQSVRSAVDWFRDSRILNTRIKIIDAPEETYTYHRTSSDKVVVEDPDAPPIWSRFYELKTNRPLFANRDGNRVYSLAEVARERRTGYGWYTYEPQQVLDQYPAWLNRVTAE